MKTNFNFKDAKIGDKVYHVVWGWTEIKDKNEKELQSGFGWFLFNGKKYNDDENPTIYPYNPFEQNQERVVEVSDDNLHFVQRRLILILPNNMAMCWVKEKHAIVWSYWREIQPPKLLTQEEKINLLWDKFGNDIC